MKDYKEETKKSYNENFEYHSNKFCQFFDLDRRYEFPRFIELIQGKEFLDVGAGNGIHAEYFKKRGLNPFCIDISEKMVKACKKKGLNSQVMDLENLKFEDEIFDGIWSVTSLLHIPKKNISKVKDELARVLKTQGVLFLSVQKGEDEKFKVDINDPKYKRYFSYFQVQELINFFENKFEILECREENVNNRAFINMFLRKR